MTHDADAVSINKWGPSVWSSMHSLSFSYPIACEAQCNHRMAMFDFLSSLKTLIPCEECRSHYSEWFDSNITLQSPALDSRENLAKSLHELHNDVNRRTGKPEQDFQSTKNLYLTSSKSCPALPNAPNATAILLVASLALVVAALVVSITKKTRQRRSI